MCDQVWGRGHVWHQQVWDVGVWACVAPAGVIMCDRVWACVAPAGGSMCMTDCLVCGLV